MQSFLNVVPVRIVATPKLIGIRLQEATGRSWRPATISRPRDLCAAIESPPQEPPLQFLAVADVVRALGNRGSGAENVASLACLVGLALLAPWTTSHRAYPTDASAGETSALATGAFFLNQTRANGEL